MLFVFLPCQMWGQAAAVQANRVADAANLQPKQQLSRHTPLWAASVNRVGAASADTAVRLTFVLARAPEREAAFNQLLAEQQNPSSQQYHQWLTPKQIGEQFGPTQHDLDALVAWLRAQNLSVVDVAPSRMFVSVTGTVLTVSAALNTSFAYFTVNGERRLSTASDPDIPRAFASLVASIDGLSDTPMAPMHVMTAPQFNSNSGGHYLLPSDFAVIYDVAAASQAGSSGLGQKIAIVGRSQVNSSDISAFEMRAGFSVTTYPNVIIPPTGADPGQTGTGDQGEATLDVQRVIGTAPAARADLVIATNASGGINLAMQYEVQTLLDPIMTISFGSCEALNSAATAIADNALFSQAAAEGISVFVSSGDSGAAGCDAHGTVPPAYAQFASGNILCASPYVTCVGGTEFADTANPSQYWSTTNGTNGVSALSYIPEGAWNDPTATDSNGNTYTYISSTGGGASIYFPKPSFQTGTGVPQDGARDTPDVSFSSARHDAYFGCYTPGGSTCIANSSGVYQFAGFSGTSAAAPSMAAITALLNQKLGGSQGNLNPLLYSLAATPSNGAFHDTTVASSGITGCTTATPSLCNNSTPSLSALTGGLAGFTLTTGYDQATGLGSLDVSNFVNAAAKVAKSGLIPTGLSVSANTATLSLGQNETFTETLTASSGTASGTVQLYVNTTPLGTPTQVTAGTPVTATIPMTTAGNVVVTGVYAGTSSYAGSTSSGIALTVTGKPSTTAITTASPTVVVNGTDTFTATVSDPSSATIPTGLMTFVQSGTAVASVPIVNGVASSGAVTFATTGNIPVYANYRGDSTYAPSSSAVLTIVSTAVPPSYAVSASPTALSMSAGAATGNTSTITVAPSGGFTGTVTLACTVAFNGSTAVTFAPTCALSPNTVTIAGTMSGTTTLTLTTTQPHAKPAPLTAGVAVWKATWLALLLPAILLPLRRARVSRLLAALCLLGSLTMGLSGCGSKTTPVGTTTGSYAVTVTNTTTTAGVAVAAPLSLTLTVN